MSNLPAKRATNDVVVRKNKVRKLSKTAVIPLPVLAVSIPAAILFGSTLFMLVAMVCAVTTGVSAYRIHKIVNTQHG